MTSSPVSSLLQFTKAHIRQHEAVMRATGGHFNLFQVLGIGHYEVSTHSPILAELLNPRGRHGQGELFLNLFLKQVEIDEAAFGAKGATVTTEYYIGPVTEDTGGRIDILIQGWTPRRILIENKIYAGDQENQLKRYRNFDPDAHLYYLTLSGEEPSNLKGAELKATRCEFISYGVHIRNWLIDCRKEAACLPGIRETLSQYIALIEDLTHQSTTIQMSKELIEEIIKSPENLRALFTLRDAVTAVQTELIARLDAALEQPAKDLGLTRDGPLKDLSRKEGGFYFGSEALTKENLAIGFIFEMTEYRDFIFGFSKINKDSPCPLEERLRSACAAKFSLQPSEPWWPAWAYFEYPYSNWGSDAFEALQTGLMAKNIVEKLKSLAEIFRDVSGNGSRTGAE